MDTILSIAPFFFNAIYPIHSRFIVTLYIQAVPFFYKIVAI